MAVAVTREDFTALVADLRAEITAAPRIRREEITHHAGRPPAAFTGRPWAAAPVGLREAARLTGHAYSTLHAYACPGAARHHPAVRFPPPVPPARRWRTWLIGDLALWAATRRGGDGNGNLQAARPRHPFPSAGGPKPTPAAVYAALPWRHTGQVRAARARERAVVFSATLVRADPALTAARAARAARAAGVTVPRWPAVMDAARAAATPAILDTITPRHPAGATAGEIAAAFGVTRGRVAGAMSRGEIRAVTAGRRILADPSRLRYRRETGRQTMPAPADKNHPAAVRLPQDQEET